MNLAHERMLARVRKQAQRAFPVLAQCAGCCEPATQRHHDDYSKPLEITPYCQQCQTDWHVKRGTWGRMKKLAKNPLTAPAGVVD